MRWWLTPLLVLMLALTTTLSASENRLTQTDLDKVTLLEKRLRQLSVVMASVQKGAPFVAPIRDCYRVGWEAASSLDDNAEELVNFVFLSINMKDRDDQAIVNRLASVAAGETVLMAEQLGKNLYGAEGECSEDQRLKFNLDALRSLVTQAHEVATALEAKLPKLPPPSR
jgi:hypothetical protein